MTHTLRRDGIGIGLRPSFYAALRERAHTIDFVEVIAENYVGHAPLAARRLAEVAGTLPVVAHSIGLNIGGTDPIDTAHVARIAQLVARHQMPFATDHLAWCGSRGRAHHDLLPLPCSSELVTWIAGRIAAVQRAIGVPFGIENPSTYLRFVHDDLAEWEFLARIAQAADCGILLDINNVYVSSQNHGFDPLLYLEGVPWERVLYVHLAGHTVRADGIRHDTHDCAVDDAVWALYRWAWQRWGPFPTLLEWDDRIPPLDEVIAEAARARQVRA